MSTIGKILVKYLDFYVNPANSQYIFNITSNNKYCLVDELLKRDIITFIKILHYIFMLW